MAIRNIIFRPIFHPIKRPSIFITIPSSQTLNSLSFSNTPASNSILPSQLLDFVKKNESLPNLSSSPIEKFLKIISSVNPSNDFVTPLAIKNVFEVSGKHVLSPDDFSQRLKILKDLGLNQEGTITRILETVPDAIMFSEEEIHGKIVFLTGIGIEMKEIDMIIRSFPGILLFEVENRLKRLLDEFTDLNFSLSDVRTEILNYPLILGLEIGEISRCLEMVRSLKCRAAIKDKIFRNGDFRAAYDVKLRVDCLRKYGLIYRDAFGILWREPRVILYKMEDVEKKIEFLVHVMKLDVQCLVEVPQFLGVNFDKQIVPRFNVIEYLRKNGGFVGEVSLRNLVKLSRLRFYNLYVKPYPECEKIYGRFVGEIQGQKRHPVGMWKVFRPQKYQETGEDVKNIKDYVESLR